MQQVFREKEGCLAKLEKQEKMGVTETLVLKVILVIQALKGKGVILVLKE